MGPMMGCDTDPIEPESEDEDESNEENDMESSLPHASHDLLFSSMDTEQTNYQNAGSDESHFLSVFHSMAFHVTMIEDQDSLMFMINASHDNAG